MKLHRFINSVICSFLLIALSVMPSNAAQPSVYLDGRQLLFDVPPVVENGRTLVPMRAIFEAMGATVEWDQDTQTAAAVKGNTKVVLQIGSLSSTINGQVKELDVPAKIVNGRTLAPLRFVGEAFGGTVGWDQASQTVTIFSVPPSGTPPPAQASAQIKVHFIDVGQADSIYIQLPDNNDILIDAGNVADGPTVVSYLKAQGVDDIELMIATHPHEDHIGGLPAVLSAFVVEQVIDSCKTASTKTYSNYATAVQAEGCPWGEDMGQTFTWGNATLEILTGQESWQDVNNYSVISRLDCGDIEFLFTGDAERLAELSPKGDISAEILKVGHHGSKSSTSPGFLSRVNPEVAVISVGAGNTYGHPAADTLTRLNSAGVTVYRTDLNGTIVVTTDGKTYSVKTGQGGPTPTVTTPAPVAPVITQPTPQNNSDSTIVYVTKTGSKYHSDGCRHLGKSKIPMSLQEAKASGYTPCSVCGPPR